MFSWWNGSSFITTGGCANGRLQLRPSLSLELVAQGSVTLPDWFETVESAPSLLPLGTELANSQRFVSRALCKSKRWRGLLTMRSSEVNIPFWLTGERYSLTFERRWCTSFVIVAVLHTCRMEMNMDVWNPPLPSLFDSKYHGDIHCPSTKPVFKHTVVIYSPSCCYFKSWVRHRGLPAKGKAGTPSSIVAIVRRW